MTNIGQLMSGSNHKKERDPYDFNPTPPEPTKSLIQRYRTILNSRPVWEPSCGEGHIAKVLDEELDVPVLATDIYHRGFGMGGISFLDVPVEPFKGRVNIIQNPPFNIAAQIIEKSHQFEPPFLAMFLKVQFWNVLKNKKLWELNPPKAIHPLTWRVDFTGQGRSTMDTMWVVWGEDVPFSNEPMGRPVEPTLCKVCRKDVTKNPFNGGCHC